MVLVIKTKKDAFVEKIYDSSMKELDDFFKLGWTRNRPNVVIVPDRKTIDALRGQKTESWVVGWSGPYGVYVLDRKNYNKESSNKYSDYDYAALIKHELAHAFTLIVSGYKSKPKWLWEGIATYLSGQNKYRKKPKKYGKFLKYYDVADGGVYYESGFAVEFLVKKFGEKKMLNLIKSLKNINSEEEFKNKFKEIYGFEPNYKKFK